MSFRAAVSHPGVARSLNNPWVNCVDQTCPLFMSYQESDDANEYASRVADRAFSGGSLTKTFNLSCTAYGASTLLFNAFDCVPDRQDCTRALPARTLVLPVFNCHQLL
ncbi:MAG: hypothetical protein KME27_25680 [Lyngbya sp. HA4199-MV5]|nr:hypothetical protein [Lyngbya sp. HA4199-MV5]